MSRIVVLSYGKKSRTVVLLFFLCALRTQQLLLYNTKCYTSDGLQQTADENIFARTTAAQQQHDMIYKRGGESKERIMYCNEKALRVSRFSKKRPQNENARLCGTRSEILRM